MQKRRTLIAAAAAATVLTLSGCATVKDWTSSVTDTVGGWFSSSKTVQLTGAAEVPPVTTAGNGTFETWYDKDTRVLKWKLAYAGLSGPATAAHIHGPAPAGQNGPVMVGFANPITSPMEGQATLTPAQAAEFVGGRTYVNVHTAKNPNGEIRGQIAAQ